MESYMVTFSFSESSSGFLDWIRFRLIMLSIAIWETTHSLVMLCLLSSGGLEWVWGFEFRIFMNFEESIWDANLLIKRSLWDERVFILSFA